MSMPSQADWQQEWSYNRTVIGEVWQFLNMSIYIHAYEAWTLILSWVWSPWNLYQTEGTNLFFQTTILATFRSTAVTLVRWTGGGETCGVQRPAVSNHPPRQRVHRQTDHVDPQGIRMVWVKAVFFYMFFLCMATFLGTDSSQSRNKWDHVCLCASL